MRYIDEFSFTLGGETIKQINQQTGAHCEIDRRQQANMQEKIFIIKGTPEQIENAKRMFSEKLNMVNIDEFLNKFTLMLQSI